MTPNPEELAARILNVCWDKELPVDPFDIAKRVGIDLRPFPHLNKFWRDEGSKIGGFIAGPAFRETDGFPNIVYNPHHHQPYLRLGVARSLGHFAMGHCVPITQEFKKANSLYFMNGLRVILDELFVPEPGSRQELALTYALKLLMPTDEIVKAMQLNITAVKDLAERFQVPKEAVEMRLRGLNIEPN